MIHLVFDDIVPSPVAAQKILHPLPDQGFYLPTMINQIIVIVIVLAAAMTSNVAAFTASRVHLLPSTTTIAPPSSTAIHAAAASSRRDLFSRTGSVIATALVTAAAAATSSAVHPALAADGGAPPTAAEIERIRTGYENIRYLLANWEKETTVCRANGGECERNADACRKYMGLRSTTDPLFQIEKVFAKVKYMDDIDPDKLDSFFEATEDW